MGRTGVTIDAAVLTPAVGVEADPKADIRAGVITENGPRGVTQQAGFRAGILHIRIGGVRLIGYGLKAIRRIAGRTASLEPGGGVLHGAVHPTRSLALSLYFRYWDAPE